MYLFYFKYTNANPNINVKNYLFEKNILELMKNKPVFIIERGLKKEKLSYKQYIHIFKQYTSLFHFENEASS